MRVLSASWFNRNPRRDPFPWLATAPGEICESAIADQLAASFPDEGFVRIDAAGDGRGKTYRNYSRPLVECSEVQPGQLPGIWGDLLSDLTSAQYRTQIAILLGQPAARAIEARLVRHGHGDWLSPHTDRPDKVFSHILYFTPGWRADWGGCLEILSGSDPSSVVGQVVPELGASALMARTDNSWHQVAAVTAGDTPERRSLLIHGLR